MIYGWTSIAEPPTKTGEYLVIQMPARIVVRDHFFTDDTKWFANTKMGWQKNYYGYYGQTETLKDLKPTHWMEIFWPE